MARLGSHVADSATWRQAASRMDDLENAIDGMGVAGRDKTRADRFRRAHLRQAFLEEVYRGSDMAARCVNIFPDHMLREGWELVIPGSEKRDTAQRVVAYLQDNGALQTMHRGMRW